jgi:hypothetical protein
MSVIGLSAIIVLVLAVCALIGHLVYQRKHPEWKERHWLAAIVLNSLLMFTILSMFGIAGFDASGNLWSSEHQLLIVMCAVLSITSATNDWRLKNKIKKPWARVRPLLIALLLCLMLWYLASWDFLNASFDLLVVIILLFQIRCEKSGQT